MVTLFSAQYTTRTAFPDEKAAGRLMHDYVDWAVRHNFGVDLSMMVSPRCIRIAISFSYTTEKVKKTRLAQAVRKMRALFGEVDAAKMA